MDISLPLPLLGGRSPADFMQRYWQRRPLLIRGAIPNIKPPASPAQIKRLAREDDVESRLIWQEADGWEMESGPFARLPPAREDGWTLLVQGLNLHVDAAADLMAQFRFIPDARLDDVMVSIATNGGGVGPHFDNYDVFLLQGAGRRRWRIGKQKDLSLVPGVPLKLLQNFQPTEEFVLEAGDMLYLPPHYAHDGIAEGDDCMTLSIGFRSPSAAEMAQGMLELAAEDMGDAQAGARYRDPGIAPTRNPAQMPDSLLDFAIDAASRVRFDAKLATRFLGRWLTEPKANVVFGEDEDAADLDLMSDWPTEGALVADRRTQMLYRGKLAFINGEEIESGATPLLKKLADQRRLDFANLPEDKVSEEEREQLADWLDAGWLRVIEAD
ncbi:cupin domain-containing protein [Pigmentiphaga aceris]|uniref:Cupin domain-containing protein n=1 Tax=Pigmentiphaga aceris TaxID=1940612 RepID=A0A5C0ATC3_9BURK|nr:cupin domain-containing protein [Pigmentiphaga aceris]QEI05592.1 cupin domain-containing protein [Pigmentiphaga aceris]